MYGGGDGRGRAALQPLLRQLPRGRAAGEHRRRAAPRDAPRDVRGRIAQQVRTSGPPPSGMMDATDSTPGPMPLFEPDELTPAQPATSSRSSAARCDGAPCARYGRPLSRQS